MNCEILCQSRMVKTIKTIVQQVEPRLKILKSNASFSIVFCLEEKALMVLYNKLHLYKDQLILNITEKVDPPMFNKQYVTSLLALNNVKTTVLDNAIIFNNPINPITLKYQSIATLYKIEYVFVKQKINNNRMRSPTIQTVYKENEQDDIYLGTIKQDGIQYCYMPKKTMFCNRNIKEKMRIANDYKNMFNFDKDIIVLDLYAGVGYFTLPYIIKFHASVVYSVDLNIYSIVGLVVGAIKNKIRFEIMNKAKEILNCKIYLDRKVQSLKSFVLEKSNKYNMDLGVIKIFYGDNASFAEFYKNKATHVNLGLLPTSRPGYEVALSSLNTESGGYLHIHENVIKNQIYSYGDEIVQYLNTLTSAWVARLLHVFVVKEYAPNVMHCVYDIHCCNK